MSNSSGTDPRPEAETVTYKTSIQPNERMIDAIVRLLEKLPASTQTEVSPLYDHADPEALEQLFANTETSTRTGTATVAIGNLEIVVRDGERVEIRVIDETDLSNGTGGRGEHKSGSP
ncbi:hypothetical protein HALLA_06340 [Halostagnicola larsenii XH-48]|uniref:Halobacterial output domain-containing protein n=1 Tax=Halostagnicola larsenii XH-48 TaxID=797299 RepID=W0JUP1_9EURY|nr:HalOD1 output domain-containing protein [Halostagnicola larsenii]AHG00763.1 hypothetical protein HALLA_06340 [Halostagnicola larsenii XH-48]